MTKKAPRGTLPDWSRWPAEGDHCPLIAVDPGEGTGIVLLTVGREQVFDGWPYDGVNVIWYEEITGPENEQADTIMDLAYEVQDNYRGSFPLLLEDFSLRMFSRGAELLTPVRLNAKIEYGVWASDPPLEISIQKQLPSMAMTTVTDDRLRAWDLYARGQKNARVAMKHALTFVRRARENEKLRNEAWK